MNSKNNSQTGLSLIEVLLAVALITLVTTSLLVLGVTSLRTADAGRARAIATEFNKEAIEAARAQRDENASALLNLDGYYAYDGSTSTFIFRSATQPSIPSIIANYEVSTGYYCVIFFEPNVSRTKSTITASTYWNQHGNYPKITSSTYLTKWR